MKLKYPLYTTSFFKLLSLVQISTLENDTISDMMQQFINSKTVHSIDGLYLPHHITPIAFLINLNEQRTLANFKGLTTEI